MWVLRTVTGSSEEPLTFRVMPGAVKTMGRAVRADFILDAPLVSRVHCRFTATPAGALEGEDIKSTNGTFVNDTRITRSALAPGDRIRVGRVEMTVAKEG
jgi:pSer/pThr/pTyr-binding forkhead associated (FHA) protein